MRKFFLYSAMVLSILGIAFTILPLGTIALFPIILALLLSGLAIRVSDLKQKRFPKIVLLISILTLLVVVGKEIFIKDNVAVDKQFELKKTESKKEDIKDLEGL